MGMVIGGNLQGSKKFNFFNSFFHLVLRFENYKNKLIGKKVVKNFIQFFFAPSEVVHHVDQHDTDVNLVEKKVVENFV